jgi:hypothetical protein
MEEITVVCMTGAGISPVVSKNAWVGLLMSLSFHGRFIFTSFKGRKKDISFS